MNEKNKSGSIQTIEPEQIKTFLDQELFSDRIPPGHISFMIEAIEHHANPFRNNPSGMFYTQIDFNREQKPTESLGLGCRDGCGKVGWWTPENEFYQRVNESGVSFACNICILEEPVTTQTH